MVATEGLNGDLGSGTSLDQVLARLGRFGPHQRLTLALCALLYATNSMYNVNYVFAVEDVNYRCVTSCQLNASSPPTEKQCWAPACPSSPAPAPYWSPNNSEALKACTAWEYDVPRSFVAEFGLACQEWKHPLPGTAHCFGSMLGLLFQGQISDRLGRKNAAVFAGTMAALLGLAKSFASSFWCYIALETLEAAVGDALSPIFMLSVELGPKKYAVIYQMILLNCYTGGLILMSLIAWLVPYWRHFLRVIYLPSLLALLYPLLLDESARWLLGTGRREQAVLLIQKIAKRNGVEIDKATLNKLEYVDESNDVEDKRLLLKTFKSRIMVQRFLVCCVWWFTITLINYGMMVSAVLVAGDKYINFALLMLMDVPANILYWLVLINSRRKSSLLVSFLVGGAFCTIQPFVPDNYAWAALGLFMCFETLATFSYNVVYMYTSELFPTHSRNSVHALCSSVGRVGSLLAPQTSLLMSYWAGLPAFLFGVTSLVSGLLVLGMPETARTQLPDSVEQAERVGRPRTKDELRERAPLGSA